MRARGFNKRIDVYLNTYVADGFGGNTLTSALYKSTWANVKSFSINSRNLTDLGIIDINNSIIVTTRKRNDLVFDIEKQFIKYRGVNYTIASYPTNVDFEDNVMQFIATRESNKGSNTIDPPV